MKIKNLFCVLLAGLLLTTLASRVFSQSSLTSAGDPQNAAIIPVEHGFINAANGNLHLEIPIADSPQRGDLQLGASLVYDSAIWQEAYAGPAGLQWLPSGGGWSLQYGANYGATATITTTSCGSNSTYTYSAVQWTDNHGTEHVFPVKTIDLGGCPQAPPLVDTPSSQAYATDGSGYFAEVTDYDLLKIWDSKGSLIVNTGVPSVGSSDFSQIDRNGNYISYGADGTVSTDTMGRSPITETVAATDANGAPSILYLDVPVTGGGSARYIIQYSNVGVRTGFGKSGVLEFSGTLRVVSSLSLPDGTTYTFSHDQCGTCSGSSHAYGLVTGITLPHGGTVSYSYNSDSNAGGTEPARWVSAHSGSDGSTAFSLAYLGAYPNTSETGGYSCGELKNVATGTKLTTTYIFSDCGGSIQPMKVIQSPSSNPDSLDRFTLLGYDFSQPCKDGACTDAQWVSLIESTTVVPSSGTVSSLLSGTAGSGITTTVSTTYTASGSGKIASVRQWDYATGTYPTSLPYAPSTSATRETDTSYGYTVNGALYPTNVSVKDSTGSTIAETQYSYDEAAYLVSPVTTPPSHDDALAAPNRGNATTIKKMPHGSGYTTPLTLHVQYDKAGTVVGMWDARGNLTSVSHDATDTYAQGITRPQTHGAGSTLVSHVTHFSRDFNTGQLLTAADENGQTTTYGYDSIGRIQSITFSNGTTPVSLESFAYPSANEIDSTINQVDNAFASATIPVSSIVDGYGRPSQRVQAGVTSETAYNTEGLVQSRTNPHTSSSSTTDGWVGYQYDELGRIKTLTLPNGHSSTYSYTLNTVNATDPRGYPHQFTYNAFGDLTDVGEPDNSGVINWFSHYTRFDNGSLKQVDQKGGSSSQSDWRGRSFTYDAFGRPATQTSKEAGQFSYLYDENGNVTQFTNANSSSNTILYTYDELNRLSTKQVGGGPTYTYSYDAQDASGDPFGVGRLTSISDGGNIGSRFQHDAFGRVVSEADCRPSDCSYDYKTQAQYDYAGNLLALTYPDGRKLEWAYDQLNRPTEEINTFWQGTEVDVPFYILASYFPTGQLQDVIDGSGVEVTTSVDPLGNLTALSYNNGTSLVSRTMSWDINGTNLLNVSDSASGRTQTFTYDQLNRLLTATDSGSTSAATNPSLPAVAASSSSFTYDAWGNLQQSGPYSFIQIIGTANQVIASGYQYDSAGNLTHDGNGNSYSYRADGHITVGNGVAYGYDALDQRVTKGVSSGTEYFYFGGKEIATREANGTWSDLFYGPTGLLGEVAGDINATPTYRIGDHIDSLLMTTDDNGNVLGSTTLQSFGQVLSNSTGDGYLLTDHEQDNESATVNTQFRQYSPTQGRWLSPDPFSGSYDLSDPQSFNRYAYALNQPSTLTDPSGLSTDWIGIVFNGRGGSVSTGAAYNPPSGDNSAYLVGFGGETSITPDYDGGQGINGSLNASNPGQQNFTYTAPDNHAASTSSSILDWTQKAFRLAGVIPEAGVIFNALNTGIDLARGNYGEAAIDGAATALSFIPGGAPAAEALGAAREAVTAAEETTTLYRAVMPTELADIVENGGALRNLGSAEGKYFATSARDASFYAKQAVNGFGDPPYTLIRTTVPNSIFRGLTSATVDRGIVAWVIPNARLVGLQAEVLNGMPIP